MAESEADPAVPPADGVRIMPAPGRLIDELHS
jgi:hypothetical protein